MNAVAGRVKQERPSKHSAGLHFEDGQCCLKFMNGLSNFGMLTDLVPQGLQQIMCCRNMLGCLWCAGVRFGFAFRLHDLYLYSNFSLSFG